MYGLLLDLHSLTRWLVVIFALWALGRALRGWMRKADWTASDRSAGLLFTISMDVQVLLGLILYVGVSPLMQAVWRDMGAAMQSRELRFFFVEHMPLRVVAAVFAHIGNAAGKKEMEGPGKHRRAAIWYALAIVAVLAGMPWFRPLLPF